MPIDFPTSPATGQTYSYGINRWIYNGVAWDKLDNHPGISAGNQISVGYQESLSGASFSVNVIEGSGSDLDADLLDGVSGERFIENLQTGLLYGGLLSINSGNTATFNITSGSGIIVTPGGSTYSYPSPTVNYVSWSGASGLTLSGLTTYDITYISMNSSGNILQNHTPFTPSQYDSQIPIGALIHPTKSYISFAKSYPHVAYGQGNQMDGFVRAFGPLKLSGHEITGYPGTLQLSRSSGSAYNLGRNYPINPNSPNIVNDTDSNPTPTIYRQYRGATAGSWITVINSAVDATNYDDGSGTLNSVAGGRYTIQRVFYYPTEPTVLLVYYGRTTYNSIDTAKAALFFEEFSESDDSADSAIFCAYLIVKSGIPDFSSTGDYQIVQAGLFRSTANIGGGGVAVATLDDLSDVSITSVANNQALIYDSSSGDWVNKSFNNLPVVTSFNGLTGAVTGVNSIRGLTGTVGISAGLGITLSTSGQTLTISNLVTNENTSISDNYLAFYGVTSGIANPKVDSGLRYVPDSNAIIGYGGLILRGLSAGGVANQNTLVLNDPNTDGIVFYTADNNILVSNFSGAFGDTTSLSLVSWDFLDNPRTATIAPITAYTGNQTFTLPDDSGTIALTKNVVSSFNGSTGAVTGVRSIRGLTGAVGITNGSGIGLSVSGQTMTFSNTGVLSINGGTGAITNVARTNVVNSFTESQSILGTGKVLTIDNFTNIVTVYPTQLEWYDDLSSTSQYWVPSPGPNPSTITFPNENGTVALTKNVVSSFNGLTGAVTGVTTGISNTFGPLQSFTNGISAAGATFSSLARFNAGISAAGATLSGNIGIPSGSTFTVNGNLVGATASFSDVSVSTVFGVTLTNSSSSLSAGGSKITRTGVIFANQSVTNQPILRILPFSNTTTYSVVVNHGSVIVDVFSGTTITNRLATYNLTPIYTSGSLTGVDYTLISFSSTATPFTIQANGGYIEFLFSYATSYGFPVVQDIQFFNPTVTSY